MLIKFRVERRMHYFRIMREERTLGTHLWLCWITSTEYRRSNEIKVDLAKDNLVDALYLDDDVFNFKDAVVELVKDKIHDLSHEALQKKINEVYRKGIDVGVDFDNLRPTPIYTEYERIGV